MADYIITLDDDQDVSIGSPDYNIGVNYEIPSKSIQYQNLILDSIASQFDGVKSTFDLYVDGKPYTPVNAQGLIISINDVVQSPGVDYNVSGSQIIFTTPPATSSDFFGVALRTVADLTRTINYVVDNGSRPMTTGNKGYLSIDVIDIKKDKYDTYPDNLTSIVGTEYPRLSSQKKNRDESLSTWTTDIVAGDILDFSVISCTGIEKCSLFLRLIL